MEDNTSYFATKADIEKLRGDLIAEIKESKSDMLKWNITLIVGLFIALLGAITGIIKILH